MNKGPKLNVLLLLALLAGSGIGASDHSARSGLLDLGEDRIYYEVSGEGYPLVLVGGGSGMGLQQWERVAPLLAKDYQVISYDPRGSGGSDNPSVRYSDSADLVVLLNHLKLSRVGLIGLSSSGGFVLEFAIQYPGRLSGVVVSAPFIPGFEFSEQMLARLDTFNQAVQQGKESYLDVMFEDPHFIPAPLDESVRPIARQLMAEGFEKGAGYDSELPIPIDPPLIEQLSRIQLPVLLLIGELDHPDVKRRNRFLAEAIPSVREIVIQQAGHNTQLENPEAFVSATDSLLRQFDLAE